MDFPSPFTWLRRKAAEAVVLGTADGLRAVTPDGETPPADLAELRQLLATANIEPKALSAAEEDAEPTTRRGRK